MHTRKAPAETRGLLRNQENVALSHCLTREVEGPDIGPQPLRGLIYRSGGQVSENSEANLLLLLFLLQFLDRPVPSQLWRGLMVILAEYEDAAMETRAALPHPLHVEVCPLQPSAPPQGQRQQ